VEYYQKIRIFIHFTLS